MGMRRIIHGMLIAASLAAAVVGSFAGVPEAAGSWASTGSMAERRHHHTATLLEDGRVLVAGGSPQHIQYETTEIFDLGTGTFSPAGVLNGPRKLSAAVGLADGRVLIVGGEMGGVPDLTVSDAEIYDPVVDAWTRTGPMNERRDFPRGVRLSDGRVLVAGSSDSLTSEIFDPVTGEWTPTGSMNTKRDGCTLTLLEDGRVLAAAGVDIGEFDAEVLDSAEIYDPAAGTWTMTGSLADPRCQHAAVRLEDGRVLVAGGTEEDTVVYDSAEIYDPAAGEWITTTPMLYPHWTLDMVLLPDGDVLVVGGAGYNFWFANTQLFHPATETWSEAGEMVERREYPVLTLLQDGRVLVTGGMGGVSALVLDTAEIWTPSGPPPGDCNGDGQISIGEVQRAVNMFLGEEPVDCGVDCDQNGAASLGEVQKVINGFLGGEVSC